ncbi:hypothetical protein [Sphingomonas aquatilis]
MLQLDKKIADTLPSVGSSATPYKWEVFEVTAKDGKRYVVSIGSYDCNVGGGGPKRIEILVANNHTQPRNTHPAMIGGGYKQHGSVRVTPGGVYLDVTHLKYLGIGSLVFNIVVEWAKRTYPGLDVVPIRIVPQDPESESWAEFEKRRDALIQFYGRFGFTWQNPPVADGEGAYPSNPMTESALKLYPEQSLTRVRRLNVPGTLDVLFDYAKRMIELERTLESKSTTITNMERKLASRIAPWSALGRRLNILFLPLLFIVGVAFGRWIG